jgi:multiple sugar transport system substrate-binding protein
MPPQVTLRGITWDHPRGYAPLAASVARYATLRPDVTIAWDRRSLREFGEAPIQEIAHRYDLIIFDHPFVGYAARHPCLVGLGRFLGPDTIARYEADTLGPSWRSYIYGSEIWGLPIDAAAQVSAARPDLLAGLGRDMPQRFDEVLELAASARRINVWMAVPAVAIDAACLVFTLSANLGHPVASDADEFLPRPVGREVLRMLHALLDIAHPGSFHWNPIQTYDRMSSSDEIVYCPYAFGYSNYARGDGPRRLRFADIPAAGGLGCTGSLLGGAGIGVTAACRHPEAAFAYADWLCGSAYQAGPYFADGGQPGSLAAWRDQTNDGICGGMLSGTIATLARAYLRPRFDGFIPFFEAAGPRVRSCLMRETGDEALLDWLDGAFSRARAGRSP